jgi:prepilin-type N-terminal cleavage/methylation domain-containing protein
MSTTDSFTGSPDPAGMRMRRNGFTLIEMVIVIVVMGLILMIAMPKLTNWSDGAAARGARTKATSMLAKARASAIQNNKPTRVEFNGTNGAVVVVGTTDTLEKVTLGTEYGVSMSPSSWSVTYDPRGIGTPSQTTLNISFTRSGKSSGLTVSGYGRVAQ